MYSDKIILVTLPRSGSTYLCKLIKQCFALKNLDFLQINPEIANIDQWKSNSQQIIEENANVIRQLKLDSSSVDSSFVNRMFLHYATQPKPFVLKYFPFDSYDISTEELIAVSKRHRIRLVFLYRKNILDALVSQIVKYNFGEIVAADADTVTASKIEFDRSILDNNIISAYQLYQTIYNTVKDAQLVDSVVAYEDLAFDSKIDSAIFYTDLNCLSSINITEKSVSPRITEHVLTELPFLKSELTKSLQIANLPVTKDFCFLLGK